MVKKILWALFIIIISLSVLAGFKTRSSFLELPPLEELKEINPHVSYLSTEKDYRGSQYYYKYDMVNLDELKNNSDIVLEVQPLDDGEPVAYSLLRKSKVLKVLHGDYKEDTVYVYEPSFFVHTGNYKCIQGYISMKKDESYIVFLQKIDAPKKLGKNSLRNGYFFTNASFGKFKIGEKAVLTDFSDEKEIYFNDVCDLPVLFNLQSDVEMYNKLLNELVNI